MSALGELETLILLAVLQLGKRAYGVSIREEIKAKTGRSLTTGAIYTALRRLESKGFIEGELRDATPVRGGRAKRYLRLSDTGLRELRATTAHFDRMRAGLNRLLADT